MNSINAYNPILDNILLRFDPEVRVSVAYTSPGLLKANYPSYAGPLVFNVILTYTYTYPFAVDPI